MFDTKFVRTLCAVHSRSFLFWGLGPTSLSSPVLKNQSRLIPHHSLISSALNKLAQFIKTAQVRITGKSCVLHQLTSTGKLCFAPEEFFCRSRLISIPSLVLYGQDNPTAHTHGINEQQLILLVPPNLYKFTQTTHWG